MPTKKTMITVLESLLAVRLIKLIKKSNCCDNHTIIKYCFSFSRIFLLNFLLRFHKKNEIYILGFECLLYFVRILQFKKALIQKVCPIRHTIAAFDRLDERIIQRNFHLNWSMLKGAPKAIKIRKSKFVHIFFKLSQPNAKISY